MDIKYLREFVVIGQSRSLQAASKKLFLVPSTLSRHLTTIEQEVGATLVYRTTTDFSLTPEGEVFLENALETINAYDQAISATKQKAKENYPAVMIGGHMRCSYCQKITMNTISYLEHTHAPVTALVYDLHTSGSIASLNLNDPTETALQKKVQISVLINSDDPMDGFTVTKIWEEPFRVAISQNHPLAETEGPLDLTDLATSRLTLSTSYHAYSFSCIKACRDCGFEPTISRQVNRCWGDMYVDRDPSNFYLVPRDDSGRLPPTRFSGLVAKKLVNPQAKLDIMCAYPEGSDESVALVARALEQTAEAMEVERRERKARRQHPQTVLP